MSGALNWLLCSLNELLLCSVNDLVKIYILSVKKGSAISVLFDLLLSTISTYIYMIDRGERGASIYNTYIYIDDVKPGAAWWPCYA